MTNPNFLPSPDHIHKTSFFLYHFSTSSFVFMSLQLMFSIFLHTHISKACSLRIFSFLYVHVSAAYSATLHIIALMILFFMSLFKFLLNNSFLWLKAFLAIPILVLSSDSHLQSLVMRAPRYLNRYTCSSISPSIVMFITPSPFIDT